LNPFLNLLVKVLRLDPAVTEIDLLARIVQHVRQALAVTRYQIGSQVFSIEQVPAQDAARVTLTNLLTPYLDAHGDVIGSDGARWHLESRRYLLSSTNTASVNDVPVPGGLVLHLVKVAPEIQTDVNALVTLGYIFHATATTPTITLLSEVAVGLLNEVALKALEPRRG
jgi:hypothetical protein